MSLVPPSDIPERQLSDLALLQAQADGAALRLAGLGRQLRHAAGTPMVTHGFGGPARFLAVVGLAGAILLVA